jgi:hypothetical protein
MKMTVDSDLAAEAKALVALAFRNGPIEDIHAGRPCEICNGRPEFSHISDHEMKTLMKSAVDALYRLLWNGSTIRPLTATSWIYAGDTHSVGTIRNSGNQGEVRGNCELRVFSGPNIGSKKCALVPQVCMAFPLQVRNMPPSAI